MEALLSSVGLRIIGGVQGRDGKVGALGRRARDGSEGGFIGPIAGKRKSDRLFFSPALFGVGTIESNTPLGAPHHRCTWERACSGAAQSPIQPTTTSAGDSVGFALLASEISTANISTVAPQDTATSLLTAP